MARIRTVKPELFRHRALFLAERESGLPLRTAFAALFCCADREGRFKWHPDELKLDCLPWDEVDFAAVLNALKAGQFIVHYVAASREYGWIPGFSRHQNVNPKEAKSVLPSPEGLERVPTRENLSAGEGKGRGTGREGKESSAPPPSGDEDPSRWRRYWDEPSLELIDTLRREVSRHSPETVWDKPPKHEAIAAKRLAKVSIPGVPLEKQRHRLLFLLHAVAGDKFWRGKLFSLAQVEHNLSALLETTRKDWETWRDDADPLEVFRT